jgi:hypothetical protein
VREATHANFKRNIMFGYVTPLDLEDMAEVRAIAL